MSFIQPLDNVRITQKFGENPQVYKQFGLKGHNGLDYGCPVGSRLYAVADGVVSEVGDQGGAGYGKFVRIQTYNQYEVTYGHMSRIDCKKGQAVIAGQVLGLSGNTGFSTGPHLHLGVRALDKNRNVLDYSNGFKGAIDPLPLLTMNTTSTTPAVPAEDPELAAAKLWAQEKKIMGLTALDQPMLRQDVLRVLYRQSLLMGK